MSAPGGASGSGWRARLPGRTRKPADLANQPKLRHSLSGVSDNLLVSLVARHLESMSGQGLLDDPWSSTLVERIGLDVTRYRPSRKARTALALRTQLVDQAAAEFLERVAEPTVVTFGAGLCTRYFRLDRPDIRWVDIDLPNVAALRQELLPDHPNRQVVTSSVLEPRWGEALRDGRPGACLFVAEGLLMFMEPDEVRALITRIAERYPGGELLAESVDPGESPATTQVHPITGANVALRWTLRDFSELTDWAPTIELVQQWSFVDRDPRTPGRPRWRDRLTTTSAQMKVGHLRFAPAAS